MDLKKILEKYFKEQVSDEAITEISTLFEAALNERVKDAIVEKETELEESNKTELAKFKGELVDKLSEYAKVAVDEFVDENRPALETECKVTISETVMSGLMDVLKEQYVVVPESETDVVADLEGKVKAAEDKLNESINSSIEDKKQLVEYEKALVFKRLVEDAELTDMDSEKVLDLLDGIEADNADLFAEKTQIIIDKVKEDAKTATDGKTKKADDLNEKVEDDDLNESEASDIDKYLP
jgi:hypothetical protein